MNIVIIGAGGIGCYYGAKLQQAGHNITYVARGAHLNAMRTHGLTVVHPEFSFNDTVNAASIDDLITHTQAVDFDLIILCIKGMHTKHIMETLHSWLNFSDDSPPVLSIQNGVSNEEVIAEHTSVNKTIGGLAIRIGGHVVSPGKIEATGVAQLVLGPWPNESLNSHLTKKVMVLVAEFNKAKIPTQFSQDIQLELWKKLLINNGVNPISALTNLDTKTLTSHVVYSDIVYRLMAETAAVARAEGINITEEDIAQMYQIISNLDGIKTSMLVDKEKGRELELEAISGIVTKKGQRHNIATPLTNLISALIQDKL